MLDLRNLDSPPLASMPPHSAEAPSAPMGSVGTSSSSTASSAGHSGRVQTVAWLPEDDRLFISGGDRALKVWDANSPGQCVVGIMLNSCVLAGALTREATGAAAAAALGDGTIRLVDLRIGRAVSTMQGHTSPALCVAWGQSGTQRLFSGGGDGTLRAWDARMGARSLYMFDPFANEEEGQPPLEKLERSEEGPLDGRGGGARKVAFGMEKATLDKIAARYEPYRFVSVKRFLGSDRSNPGHSGRVFESGPATSSPLSLLTPISSASGSEESEQDRLRRGKWKREAAEKARHFLDPPRRKYTHDPSVAHRGAIIGVASLMEHKTCAFPQLFSCGVDGKVRSWNADTGMPAGFKPAFDVDCWSQERSLQIHACGPPNSLCLVPEREHLAVYCTKAGRLLCHLAAHTADINCVDASLGSRTALTGGDDGRLLCWHLGPGPEPPAQEVICLD